MKKLIIAALFLLSISFTSSSLLAQGPPQPPNEHGNTENQPANGGSAPIGGGIAILLSLGAAYGGRKVYSYWQNQKEDLEE